MGWFVEYVRMHLGQAQDFFGLVGRGRDRQEAHLTPLSKTMRKRLASSPDELRELAGMNDLQGTGYTLREIRNWKAAASPEQVAEFDRQREEAATAFGRAGLTLPYWDSLLILRTFQQSPGTTVPELDRPRRIKIGILPRTAVSSASATSQGEQDLVELLGLSAGIAASDTGARAPARYGVPALVLKVAAVLLLALTATLIVLRSLRAVPDTVPATVAQPRPSRSVVPPPPVANLATGPTPAPQSASPSAKPAGALPLPAPAASGPPVRLQETRTATNSVERPADQADRAPVAHNEIKLRRREVRYPSAPGSRQAFKVPARPAPRVLAERSPSAGKVLAPSTRLEAEAGSNAPHDQPRPAAGAPVGATAMLAVAPAPPNAPQVAAVVGPSREASGAQQKHRPAYREIDGIDAIRSLRRQ